VGSRILSNTVVTGNVASTGGPSASFSFTFDSGGKMIAGSITPNGAQVGRGAQSGNESAAGTQEKGSSSLRANTATAAGAAAAAGTLEGASRAGGLSSLLKGMVSARGLTGVGALIWSASAGEGSDRPNEELSLERHLDHAWGDALAETSHLRNSGGRSVVIGETMDRVIPAAQKWHAQTIDFGDYWKNNPTPLDLMAGIVFNAGWMVGVMANRMQVYDIGMDTRRLNRSPNYRIERQMIDLSRYPRYEQRSWDRHGRWDYLNEK